MDHFYNYILRLADNSLILGQRLGEWCGHGPVLEQDIALTNFALDLIGQARMLYQYAAKIKGGKVTEDEIAFLRKEHEYLNVLLVEQPNQDFAFTVVRQYFFDVYHFYNYKALQESPDFQLSAIAQKSLKEVTYHLRWSSEWMKRLGDGTEESHQRMQTAVNELWMYTGELYTPNAIDKALLDKGITPDLSQIEKAWQEHVEKILLEATLTHPEGVWMQSGGKEGRHTEHMGYILTELQYMQRTYPNMKW